MKQTIAQSNDPALRVKINSLPTTESVLRAVSLFPNLDTEEKLKDFIDERIIAALKLTEIQKDYFKKQSLTPAQESDEARS
jgi:hypothetical protein